MVRVRLRVSPPECLCVYCCVSVYVFCCLYVHMSLFRVSVVVCAGLSASVCVCVCACVPVHVLARVRECVRVCVSA